SAESRSTRPALASSHSTPSPSRAKPMTVRSMLKGAAIPRLLRNRRASDPVADAAPLDGAVEEGAAGHDQRDRPVAGERGEVEPAEVVQKEQEAEHEQAAAPERRLEGLFLRRGQPAQRPRVDERRGPERVDEVVEVDEGDQERERERVDIGGAVDRSHPSGEEDERLGGLAVVHL